MSFISAFFNLLPVCKNKIVFYSFTHAYGDNPRPILEEMLRQKLPYKFVWVEANKKTVPVGVKCVRSKLRTWYEFSTARVIITNARIGGYFGHGFCKKNNQIYIQTWHGFALKKIEGDAGNLAPKYMQKAKLDSKNMDYLLSNSRFLTQVYKSSFFYDGPILEFGSPRNDCFFRTDPSLKKKLKQRLQLKNDEKVVLYAPTFRDNRKTDYAPLDYEVLKKSLIKKFGGKWRILMRVHPNLLKQYNVANSKDMIDVSLYPDMADLLLLSDVLVTDYSSCMFDFMLQGRPAFIYAPDVDKYSGDRGVYFPLTDTPFPVATDNNELSKKIAGFSLKMYKVRLHQFLHQKGFVEDGKASERVVALIKSILS